MNNAITFTWDKLTGLLMIIFWAVLVFIAGMIAIKLAIKLIQKALLKTKVDNTLHKFILSVAEIFLFIILSISCLAMLNIPTTPLITALGSVGLALSLALKDSLTNLAGGVVILFTKPFALGNYIESKDFGGTVTEIGLAYTILNTVDNKRIYVPNGDMAKEKITNYSAETTRRLELKFSVAYHDDFEKAKKLIYTVAEKSDMLLFEPAPIIRVCAHSINSIDIICRIWVKSEHYFDMNFYMLEEVKHEFDRNNISIPYNQMEVHITPNDK